MANFLNWYAGQALYAATLNAQQDFFIYKSADQSVNNSTVLVNDNTLVIATVALNATYVLNAFLVGNSSATANPDIKYGWTIGTGNTLQWMSDGQSITMTNLSDGGNRRAVTTAAATLSAGITNSVQTVTTPLGVLITGGTSTGPIQLQFAQSTAVAENSTVKSGSWLSLTRVA